MEDSHHITWRSVEGRLGGLAYQVTRVQFTTLRHLEPWRPAINAYRCQEGFVICVDLAGVERDSIHLEVESRRLLIQGIRRNVEPPESAGCQTQVLAMEIDQGPFRREVRIPVDIAPDRVKAEQRNGILWIFLPHIDAPRQPEVAS
jgi:HSP20 family protein